MRKTRSLENSKDHNKAQYNSIKPKKFFGAKPVTLAKQYSMMKARYPSFTVKWDKNELVCTGRIQPTRLSQIYTVEIRYKLPEAPKVLVIDPPLKKRADSSSIPHLYETGSLCLYYPKRHEFESKNSIAVTIVPWISLWLYFYEMWHATGVWQGGGVHPPQKKKSYLVALRKRQSSGREKCKMKRILSIDGGGIKGVFPAAFLACLEEDLQGRPIGEYFDLIVGTSTGGIIAMALGLGFSAKEILKFYEEMGTEVFPTQNILMRWIKKIKGPLYDNGPLEAVLRRKFGDLTLGNSKTRLVIPTYNYKQGEVHIYKTAHNERFKNDFKKQAVEVCLATSAAPTYFPVYSGIQGQPLIDGGVFANNPTSLAIIEAMTVLNWGLEDLCVLSLGCTQYAFPEIPRYAKYVPGGLVDWGPKVDDLFMQGQAAVSHSTATLLLGRNKEKLWRYSPNVAYGRFELDNVKRIDELRGLGFSEARKAQPDIETFFFREPAEKFVPCHSLCD